MAFENLMGTELPDPKFVYGLSTNGLKNIFVKQGLRNNCDATARLIAYRYLEKKGKVKINQSSFRTATSLDVYADALNSQVDAGDFEIPFLYGGKGTWLGIATENKGSFSKGSDYQKGLDYIDTCLKNGIPPIIGIGIPNFSSGNPDGSSDHFMVIVGKGKNGEYYYYDPATQAGANLTENVIYPTTSNGMKKDDYMKWTSSLGDKTGKVFLTFVAIYPAHKNSLNNLSSDTLASPPVATTNTTSGTSGTASGTASAVEGAVAGGVVGQDKSRGDIPGQEQSTTKTPISSKFIKQITQPQLTPKKIRFTIGDKELQKEIVKNLGNFPVVYYNGTQIDFKDVEFLQLYTSGNLPTLKLVFKDTLSLMKDRGFPLDDTIITIFIDSRTDQLKPIHLDLKIVKFSAAGRTYTITASLDANLLYVKKFKSYSKKTSFQTLQEIASEIGLGFNSNIDDTNDSMVWINPGQKCMDFIDSVVTNSYKSDETYLSAYIDFFYCLNYIDVGKEVNRNVKEELGITDGGLSQIYKKNPDLISSLVLTNEVAFRSSNVYFKKHQIINKSSTISLSEGYATKIKYYDEVKKSFLIFDIEAITEDAENKIQLKGKAEDETFYNENIDVVYVGKLDTDNMFDNYHYASIQNYRNLVDLEKIGIEVTMLSPNFNFYRYQKVLLFLSASVPTPSNSLYNNRLSGEWLIVDIIFRQDGSVFEQIIKLIKKELELTSEEANVDPKPRKQKRKDTSRGTSSNPDPSPSQPESTPTATSTAEVTSDEKYLPPATNETGNMQFSVPPPPQNSAKTSPSGFPVKSTSFIKTERKPTQFVIHYTAGWQVLDKGAGTVDFLMNGRTDYPGGLSYHYIISVDGHIENVIDPKYMASHSGDPINKYSIGISLSSLGTTFANLGIPGANKQLDSLRKSTNAHRKSLYGKNEDYVKLVNQDFQPIKYRGFESCQEVSAAQIAALGTLMKNLKSRFPTLPNYNGLTPEYFEILFPVGKNGDFGSPSYKTLQSLIYTHCSITKGKVDIAPTPRLVEFFRNLKL